MHVVVSETLKCPRSLSTGSLGSCWDVLGELVTSDPTETDQRDEDTMLTAP